MKKLPFDIPFSPFNGTTFINCFASSYLYLQKPDFAPDDFDCAKRDTGVCTGCGNCRGTRRALQEKYFMLFDTVCGRSSLRCRFDGVPTEPQKRICESDFYDGGTDGNVDFLFGYAGYDYKKLTSPESFTGALESSIDRDAPVIAKVRGGKNRFRVLIGCDGGAPLCPDFADAQNKPDHAPSIDEIETLYVFGGKIAPRYTFKDGVERIIDVMRYNISERLWQSYTDQVGLYAPRGFGNADAAEKAARMKRVAETMWHTFNCHNFAEVFRHRYAPELEGKRFDKICGTIGPCFGYTHDLAWALIGLEENMDWSKHYAGYTGEMLELTLDKIAKNDERVLDELLRLSELL